MKEAGRTMAHSAWARRRELELRWKAELLSDTGLVPVGSFFPFLEILMHLLLSPGAGSALFWFCLLLLFHFFS